MNSRNRNAGNQCLCTVSSSRDIVIFIAGAIFALFFHGIVRKKDYILARESFQHGDQLKTKLSSEFTGGVGCSEELEILRNRTFPLHGVAKSWLDVPWHDYDQLLIIGPQRSGTTWVSEVLASHLSFHLTGELSISRSEIISDLQEAASQSRQQKEAGNGASKQIFHKPTMTEEVHQLNWGERQAAVFVARDCIDVFRSQNRLLEDRGGWTCQFGRTVELPKYKARKELAEYFDPRDPICKIKQDTWLRFQAPTLGSAHAITVSYESFHTHTSFVEAKERIGFGPKQVKVENHARSIRDPGKSKA